MLFRGRLTAMSGYARARHHGIGLSAILSSGLQRCLALLARVVVLERNRPGGGGAEAEWVVRSTCCGLEML